MKISYDSTQHFLAHLQNYKILRNVIFGHNADLKKPHVKNHHDTLESHLRKYVKLVGGRKIQWKLIFNFQVMFSPS